MVGECAHLLRRRGIDDIIYLGWLWRSQYFQVVDVHVNIGCTVHREGVVYSTWITQNTYEVVAPDLLLPSAWGRLPCGVSPHLVTRADPC